MSKTLITLDGPSGVGKTTIGKRLASELKFEFFSSGLLYRVIALHNEKTNSFNLNEFETAGGYFDLAIDIASSLNIVDSVSIYSSALSYKKGEINEEFNPNGSNKNIAGIFNKEKNILGMMPHPERMIDKYLSGDDGSLFFENLINNLK